MNKVAGGFIGCVASILAIQNSIWGLFGFGVKTNSAMIPPVCLAGAFFFDFWHVPFQKNTHVEVFGVKHIKLGVISEIVYQEN